MPDFLKKHNFTLHPFAVVAVHSNRAELAAAADYATADRIYNEWEWNYRTAGRGAEQLRIYERGKLIAFEIVGAWQ